MTDPKPLPSAAHVEGARDAVVSTVLAWYGRFTSGSKRAERRAALRVLAGDAARLVRALASYQADERAEPATPDLCAPCVERQALAPVALPMSAPDDTCARCGTPFAPEEPTSVEDAEQLALDTMADWIMERESVTATVESVALAEEAHALAAGAYIEAIAREGTR